MSTIPQQPPNHSSSSMYPPPTVEMHPTVAALIGPASSPLSEQAEALKGLWPKKPRKAGRDPFSTPDSAGALQIRTADQVELKAIKWLWRGWIARGYINLLVGETGSAKSTVLADIAARITTGRPWPGEPESEARKPSRVLWLGSEDSMCELTGPRLKACQANLANVSEITGVTRDGKRDTFSLQDDNATVKAELAKAKAEGLPYDMLVIDPVTSYLPGKQLRKVDMNDNGQLRSILEPWMVLAQETDLAVVCVTHLAKDTTRALLHRVLGAGVFTHTARSLCAVVKLPDSEYARALMQIKNNLPGSPSGAWRFSTAKVQVGTDAETGQPIDATYPQWEAIDTLITPESLAGGARGPSSSYAGAFRTWITTYFQPSMLEPKPVNEVRQAAIQAGVTSASWWNEHSGEFLEKQNANGVWICRPLIAI